MRGPPRSRGPPKYERLGGLSPSSTGARVPLSSAAESTRPRRKPRPDQPTVTNSRGTLQPGELFLGLELFVHGGVRYEPYRDLVEAAFGRSVRRLEVYPASEGFLAVQDDLGSEGMLLGLDYGSFYEFIPAAEAGSSSARRLTLADVTVGETYSIVLSNEAGLWASPSKVVKDCKRVTYRKNRRLPLAFRPS